MFSVGKPFAIFAFLMLAERGEISLDALEHVIPK